MPGTPATRRLQDAGQGHLVAHARGLPEAEAGAFLEGCAGVPWEALREALETPPQAPAVLRPPQALTRARLEAQPALRERLARLGTGLLAGGRVAALLLAGGQGTRLGHPGPKGTVVFGPDPGRTLFRIQAERVAAATSRHGRAVPLYVLAGPDGEAATREAFATPEAFGLRPGQVRFLVQGTLPCLDEDGRALLAGPGRLARAPDGHGGTWQVLAAQGVPSALRAEGIDVLVTFQVDNPLAHPLDPVMLGWMVERRLQAVGKAVRKAAPDERVGVFARGIDGRLRVVEYTEMTRAATPAAPGEPVEAPLVMGSIALHAFSTRLLEDLAVGGLVLPLHPARKRVPFLGPDGRTVEPEGPNAWKLERFLFDLFPQAQRAEVHEVVREREFAPVKNARGVDSLATARALVESEVRRWHRARGLPAPEPPVLDLRAMAAP